MFYCLRFEAFLFVASYDYQGYGGGIRSRLHTGSGLRLSVFVCYNRQPEGLEDTLSNPSVSWFAMQRWLAYSFLLKSNKF
jgi:hypothetical protein